MKDIKKLALQTLWYGLPTILTRFIGLTLSIIVLRLYPRELTGEFQLIYVVIPILMVIYTYGMETSYFNFAIKIDKYKLFNTTFTNIILTSIVFTLTILYFASDIARWLNIPHQTAMVQWMAGILFMDTIAAIPYAKLRQEERPRKFAFIKMMMVIFQFVLVVVIYHLWIPYLRLHPDGFLSSIYHGNDLLYFIIANFLASTFALLLLYNEYKAFRPRLDSVLTSNILRYSLPLVLIGVIGMSNESLGRIIFDDFLHMSQERIDAMRGVLLTIYKLAMLINVFTQMFRIAAEPFFFSKSVEADAKSTYSQSLIMYMIVSSFAFLLVVFFQDIWLSIFTGQLRAQYVEGLPILPILAITLVLNGIYYTMTVWYKLTDNNLKGAIISFIGLLVNLIFLVLLVEKYTYTGVAIAGLASTLSMVLVSYFWGQRYYPVPYNIPKVVTNFAVLIVLYFIFHSIQVNLDSAVAKFFVGTIPLLMYLGFVLWMEQSILRRIPYLKKLARPQN